MKSAKAKKKKKKLPDLTKIPEHLLEKEVNRRAIISRQKEREKSMKKMYELYQTRISCPILGKAYLPDGFSVSYWSGLDTLKKFEIASIRFGEHRGNKNSSVDMNVSRPTFDTINSVVHSWDKVIKDFWKETYENFNSLVVKLIKDPARIAIMMAATADNFNLYSETASEVEVEYYNKIVGLFNSAVVERFKEYSDEILIDALQRIEKGEARPGSFGDRDDAADMLMAVLNSRGHSYKLNSEKWAETEEAQEVSDFDDSDYDLEEDEY